MKVYDLLGNKIETLVRQEEPAGNYELSWNAASLPGGTYFYKLQAGSCADTEKMILPR